MLDIKDYESMVKLCLTEDERVNIERRVKVLEDSFAALGGIDTDRMEPLVTVLTLNNILREDTADKILPRDEILRNAPEQYEGYFQVPGTLE